MIASSDLGRALVRYRRPKNCFSWGPLVPVLKQTGIVVELCKKNPADHVIRALSATSTGLVFYFDSMMSADAAEVGVELASIRASVPHSEANRVIFSAGGSHPTACPVETLELGFQIAARGEGERVIGEIVNAITQGRPWDSIPGIAFKDQAGKVIMTPMPPLVDISEFISFCEQPPVHPPIEIMRGCAFGCRYCQTPRLHCGRVRYRSIESIEFIVSNYCSRFPPPVDIRFICPNSLAYCSKDNRSPNLEALRQLVAVIKKYPTNMFLGSFPSEVRPDFVTPETVEILKASATKVVALGGQSGSDDVLKRMCRMHTVEHISIACNHLLAGGLIPQVDFILGTPDESTEEQWQTLRLVNDLVKRGCQIRLHYFMPLPGTPWAATQPAPLGPGIASEAGRLLKTGQVDGSFAHQIEVACALTQGT